MKKFIVLESYMGSAQDVYTVEAHDVFEAYELAEERGHNLTTNTVYDLQEARKLALKIIKEIRKNGSSGVNQKFHTGKSCSDKLFAKRN